MAQNILKICEVLSVEDNNDGNRIKVRLQPEDNSISEDKDLPYAFPLLPQLLHIKPKVGEAVLILTALANNNDTQRFYIGPVISQIGHMDNESYLESVENLQTSHISPDPSQTKDKNNTLGAIPDDKDIAIVGRRNSDIILTDNDIRVRCGCKKVNPQNVRNFSFNSTSPAYVKLKTYDNSILNDDACESSAAIVADKINLIGNKSKDNFTTGDPKELITDEELIRFMENAHELPYGDVLVKFLRLFRSAFINHTHPFPGFTPCQVDEYIDTRDFNLDSMLSDSVKIN